jgi:hypothetical protein
MTTCEFVPKSCVDEVTSLSKFCDGLFTSLMRSDQRRWGEVYVQGLVSVPGRKSIRRISEMVVGHDADQSLQQFVNQSPWMWEPVRQRLAERITRTLHPTALVIQEVVFPKNGDSSVAVARQYAPPAGRMLNCQRAIAVFLAGEDGSCPVNWRLIMPPSWDEDTERRAKTRVPAAERSQAAWRYMLDVLDEMIGDWDLPRIPIVVDVGNDPGVSSLLRGLEERGLHYLVGVCALTPAVPASCTTPDPARQFTVGQLAAAAAKRVRSALAWHGAEAAPVASAQFVVATVPGSAAPEEIRSGNTLVLPRRVLAEWPPGLNRPRSQWLTNLGGTGVVEMTSLLRIRQQVADDVQRLVEEIGIRHFEGRSYQGWHHHVTLASIAHGYLAIRHLDRKRLLEELLCTSI